MKILVIGGSYFYGRVFVMLTAPQHEITVVNRGTYSMADRGWHKSGGTAEIRRCGGICQKGMT